MKIQEALVQFMTGPGMMTAEGVNLSAYVQADRAFYAGAAAMAEICAGGSAQVLQELEAIKTQLSEFKCRGGRCVYD